MNDLVQNVVYLVSRYLHIICGALLLGGTLFYELIVPVAIDDLKDTQQQSVFARARWSFRGIVWFCAIVLLASGAVNSYRNWYGYNGVQTQLLETRDALVMPPATHIEGPGIWWFAHVIGGLVAVGIALGLVIGRMPPRYPIFWMRLNLAILLLLVFFASTARHLRQRIFETHPDPRLTAEQ